MRILILTCNIGGGHNTCAKALQQYFTENGCVCDIADALGFVSVKLSHFISWGHVVIYRHIPGLSQMGYSFAERHRGISSKYDTEKIHLNKVTEKISDYISKGSYYSVICTHVFAAFLLSHTIKNCKLKIKSSFVATDYTCSPGASAKGLDYYFIPDTAQTEEFASHGVPREKIVASGIPVEKEFYEKAVKPEAKQKLGASKEKAHLIMSCGSMGCGPMEHLAALIAQGLGSTAELSVICGTNERLRQKLEAHYSNDSRIHIHGYMDDMSLVMDSADLFITKPGGLSTTEAATKELPMVLVNTVSGCEEYNLNFFLDRNCAVTAKTPEELARTSLELLNDPLRLQKMSQNFDGVRHSDAAKTIYSYMVSA